VYSQVDEVNRENVIAVFNGDSPPPTVVGESTNTGVKGGNEGGPIDVTRR
jgi:hypothetical protein